MARRLFPDNDAWSDESSRAANSISVALADILAVLEEDGPVDIRDFHFIVCHAAGSLASELSISRRLGDPAAQPNPAIRSYPQLKGSDGNVNLLPELSVGYKE